MPFPCLTETFPTGPDELIGLVVTRRDGGPSFEVTREYEDSNDRLGLSNKRRNYFWGKDYMGKEQLLELGLYDGKYELVRFFKPCP